MTNQIEELTNSIKSFCEERDWDQFHGPKDLAIGICTEAAELLDIFRFKADAEIESLLKNPADRTKVENELGDIFFFLLRFSQRTGIILSQALENKMKLNAKKYPVDKAKGSNKKYTEL